jgi:hypothetical protein
MAAVLVTAALNAACDAVVDLVDVGAGTATVVFWAGGVGGTTLRTFDLPDPAFGAASSGTAALLGVPLSDTDAASGTVNAFSVEDQDGSEVWRGTVGTSGTDMIIDSTTIASGQAVNLNSLTLTAQNA